MAQAKSLQTVERAIEVVELLKEIDGARVTTLAEHSGIAPSTLCGYLTTLEQKEYVVKENGRYYPSLRFLHLGQYTQTRKEAYPIAKSYTKKLSEETGGRATFVVEEHGYGVFVHRDSGTRIAWSHKDPGNRIPLHSTAAGKAILAELPEADIHEILDERGLPRQTDRTTTDRGLLFEELETIRERGYALNRGENHSDVWAVGVAVTGPEDEVVGSFSVSGAEKSMDGDWFEEELPEQVLSIANEFELDLRMTDSKSRNDVGSLA